MANEQETVRPRSGPAIGGAVALVGVLAIGTAVLTSRFGGDEGRESEQPTAVEVGVAIRTADGVVTRPDGTTVDTGLPDADQDDGDLQEMWLLADGRLVVRVGLGTRAEIRVFGLDGRPGATFASGPEYPHGTSGAVAWPGGDGRLRVLVSGTPDPLTLAAPPKRDRAAEKGLEGYGLEAVDCTEAAGCEVVVRYVPEFGHLDGPGDDDVFLVVHADGWDELDLDPDENVLDESDDGTTQAVGLADGCMALRDVRTATVSARTCDSDLGRLEFVPGGDLLVAVGSEVVVLDRELEVVRTVQRPDDLLYLSHEWTRDGDLLFVAMDTDEAVPGVEPEQDRPTGQYEWYLVDVPVDGDEFRVLEGPVLGAHNDTNRWVWYLTSDRTF